MVCALGVTTAAQASPIFELVGDVSGDGGFNPRVTGASSASAYFNPALLSEAKQQVEVGFMVLSDQISLTLDWRPGGAVPQLIGDRNAFNPGTGEPISNDTIPTDWLENGCKRDECADSPMVARKRQEAGSSANTRAYSIIGVVAPIVKKRLVLGIHSVVPMGEFTNAHSFYNDEREQFFTNSLHPELYSDRLTAMSVAFGLGSELSDALSVGIGFTVNLINTANAGTYVRDAVDYETLRLSNEVAVNADMTPHFGVTLRPSENLSLSTTLHTEQRFEVRAQFAALLPVGNESETQRVSVHNFVPTQLAFGADLDFNPQAEAVFGLVSTVVYRDWSSYVDRQGEAPTVYGEQFAWDDTISASAGLRYRSGASRALLDFTVVPSPVPEQVGRSNYVDNTRVGLALGAQWDMEFGELTVVPGFQLQAQQLLSRYNKKDDELIRDEVPDGSVDAQREPIPQAEGLQTNNPGWPGFSSEGWILAGAISVAFVY